MCPRKLSGLLLCLSLLTSAAWAGPKVSLKSIKLAFSEEPPGLNSMRNADRTSHFILAHIMEGLTRVNSSGDVVPGAASEWKREGDVLTFKIRKGAVWSDGVPLTSDDFAFAWKKIADPSFASPMAQMLYCIAGADEIAKGKKPPSELGVETPTKDVLRVRLSTPCPYFPGFVASTVFLPVRADVFEKFGKAYAAEAGNLISNGPFRLKKWVHGSEIVLDKNPKYWGQSSIRLDEIQMPFLTSDSNATVNFLVSGAIDLADGLPLDSLPRLTRAGFQIKSYPTGGLCHLAFNMKVGRVTRDPALRHRISELIVKERAQLVRATMGPGTKVARGWLPSWMLGKPARPSKVLSAKAVAKGAVIGPVTLTLLTSDSPKASREAEFFQFLLKKAAIDLKIDKQTFKARLAKMYAEDFDILATCSGPDYPDPLTFLDMKTSHHPFNWGRFVSPAFDQAVESVSKTHSPKERLEALYQAEDILLSEAAVIPLFEPSSIYGYSKKISGVTAGPQLGGFDLRRAYSAAP